MKSRIKFFLIFLILSSCLLLFMTNLLFKLYFDRNDLPKNHIELTYSDIDTDKYPRREKSFYSGKNLLQGYLYGENNTNGIIVFAHGIESGADTYLNMVTYFVDQGWQVFAFDGTGTRRSTGRGIRGLVQTKLDIRAALSYLNSDEKTKEMSKMLLGHSMGGYAVTSVLDEEIDVDAVVSIAAFNSPNGVMFYQAKKILGPLAYLTYPFITLQNFIIFGEESSQTAIDGINTSGIPNLIIYGTGDEIVPHNQVGLFADRDKLTNSNAHFLEISEDSRKHHATIWLSAGAAAYSLEIFEAYDELKKEYGLDIPDNVFQERLGEIDKAKMYEIDEELMKQINDFYLNK